MTQMKDNKIILITNDDGIYAPGIHRLAECMPADADVYMVAPIAPHSGQSSAITVKDPLRITPHPEFTKANIKAFSVNGTPVDCVKLALHTILPRVPDFCTAGINHGSNAGTSIIYSGTLGAVLEGCTLGIPSVGFSLLDHSMQADFSECLPYVKNISQAVITGGLPRHVCLNVNFPAGVKIKGAKVVASALSHWTDEYDEYIDPQGHKFYMLTGNLVNEEPENEGTDLYWLNRDYASIVPATPNQNYVPAIPHVKGLLGY